MASSFCAAPPDHRPSEQCEPAPPGSATFSILVQKALEIDPIDTTTPADYYWMVRVWNGTSGQWMRQVSSPYNNLDAPVFNDTRIFAVSPGVVHFTISLLDDDFPPDVDDIADIGSQPRGSDPSYDQVGDNVYYRNASFYGVYNPGNCSLSGDAYTLDGDYYRTTGVGDGGSQNDASLWFAVGPPCVRSAAPGGSGVSGYANVSVEFTAPMDWKSVEAAFSISPAVVSETVPHWRTREYFFHPAKHLKFGAVHTVTISAAALDFAGLPLGSAHTWDFQVEANGPPVADAGPNQTARIFETVYVDGSGSYDLTGDIDNYTWDFGDGSAPGYGVAPPHAYQRLGTFTVRLTVTDDSSATASDATTVSIALTNFLPKDISYLIVFHDDRIDQDIGATVTSHEAVGKDVLVDLAKLKLPKWAWLFDKVYAFVSRFERSFPYTVYNVVDRDGVRWSKYSGTVSWSIQRYHEPLYGYPVRIDWDVTEKFDGVEEGGGAMKSTFTYKLVLLRQPVAIGLADVPQAEKRVNLTHIAAVFATATCTSSGTAVCPGSGSKSVAAAGSATFPTFTRQYRITPLGKELVHVGVDTLPAFKLREVSQDWTWYYSISGSTIQFKLDTPSTWKDSTRWYDDEGQRSFFKIHDYSLSSAANGEPDYSSPRFMDSYDALGFRRRVPLRDGANQDLVDTTHENVVSIPIIGKTVAVTGNRTHVFMAGATLVMEVTVFQAGTASFKHTIAPAGDSRVIDTTLASSSEQVTIKVQPFIDLRLFTVRKATGQTERQWTYMRLPVPTFGVDTDGDGSYWDADLDGKQDSLEPYLWDHPVVLRTFATRDNMGNVVVPTGLPPVTVARIDILKLVAWLAEHGGVPELALAADIVDRFFDVFLDFDLDFSTSFYYLTGYYMEATNGTFENGDTVKLVWFGFSSPRGSSAVRNATTTLKGPPGAKVSMLAHRFVQAWANASMSAALRLKIYFNWWIFYIKFADITLWKSGPLVRGESRNYAPTPDYADYSFVADAQAPELRVDSPLNRSYANAGALQVRGTASDNLGLASVQARVGEGSWQECTPPLETWSCAVSLAEGANRVEVRALDTSNNPSGVTSVSVTLDTAPPTVAVSSPTGQASASEGAELKVRANVGDAGSGVARVVLFYLAADGRWTGVEMAQGVGDFAAAVPGSAVRPPGVSYYIEAVDRAGNVRTDPEAGAVVPHRVAVVANVFGGSAGGIPFLMLLAALAAAILAAGVVVLFRARARRARNAVRSRRAGRATKTPHRPPGRRAATSASRDSADDRLAWLASVPRPRGDADDSLAWLRTATPNSPPARSAAPDEDKATAWLDRKGRPSTFIAKTGK